MHGRLQEVGGKRRTTSWMKKVELRREQQSRMPKPSVHASLPLRGPAFEYDRNAASEQKDNF